MKNTKRALIGFVVAIALFSPFAFAQSNFTPPSLLPGSDEDLGGYGDACIGLATAIRTGDLHLRHIPCFVKYISKTLIAFAGSIAVIFVMYGGYIYILGADNQKDKAKKTIQYALVGLAVSLLAWVGVDIILQIITE
ncbi:hypothetical protein JXA05_03265 [Candidatus Peregrinibacteria bacterium]|nr:hypothetical protein [Candidatus Peregrinibacteria bacterium]